MSYLRNLTLKKAAGAGLMVLPVAVFLTAMVINRGWAYVVTMLAMAALWAGCFIGGMHLLTPRRGRPED